MSFNVTTEMPSSACCECGHIVDHVSGPCMPTPGDFTLCIRCGSLNVFDETLRVRAPTDDEMLGAARDSDLQRVRRAILQLHEEEGGKS